MKLIRTEDAVGQVLCHDITQIIPGQFKGARFRKGHIVQPEDIPVLLSIGKENLYVWEKRPGILHEDEAAALLYKAAAGRNIHGTEPKEGKIELVADCDGLLKIDRAARRNSGHHAHKVAHAYPGGGGDDQCLEGGKPARSLLFFAHCADHIPE